MNYYDNIKIVLKKWTVYWNYQIIISSSRRAEKGHDRRIMLVIGVIEFCLLF